MSETEILAHIIQGESGICSLMAMVAVAYMATSGRNTTWYGWQTPSPLAVWVAHFYELYPDPTPDAHYLVSAQDLQRADVRAYTLDRGPPLAVFACAGGLSLWAFA